jgi:hypothetical protein
MCRIWWVPNNASKWQMGFNWAFKGLTLLLKISIFWDVIPNILVEMYQVFRGRVSSEMLAYFYKAAGLLGATLYQEQHTQQYDVISHKTCILSDITVRTSVLRTNIYIPKYSNLHGHCYKNIKSCTAPLIPLWFGYFGNIYHYSCTLLIQGSLVVNLPHQWCFDFPFNLTITLVYSFNHSVLYYARFSLPAFVLKV